MVSYAFYFSSFGRVGRLTVYFLVLCLWHIQNFIFLGFTLFLGYISVDKTYDFIFYCFGFYFIFWILKIRKTWFCDS